MVVGLGECRRILDVARSARGILRVGHICRFNARYRMMAKIIEDGRIVAMNSGRNMSLAWTREIIRKIGPVAGDGVHDADLMTWLTDDCIVSARCRTATDRDLENPEVGQAMYRFESGATATTEAAMCMPGHASFDIGGRLAIVGNEGIIHFQDTLANLAIIDAGKLVSPDTTYWPQFGGVRGEALRDEFSCFAGAAMSHETPETDRAEGAAAAVVVAER